MALYIIDWLKTALSKARPTIKLHWEFLFSHKGPCEPSSPNWTNEEGHQAHHHLNFQRRCFVRRAEGHLPSQAAERPEDSEAGKIALLFGGTMSGRGQGQEAEGEISDWSVLILMRNCNSECWRFKAGKAQWKETIALLAQQERSQVLQHKIHSF